MIPIDQNWTRSIPRDIALELAQNRFSMGDWRYLHQQFDKFNDRFFDNHLPKPLIYSGKSKDRGGMYARHIIFIADSTKFSMNLALLHEMMHLHNALYGINGADHGFGWIESLDLIHKQLNINIDYTDWSDTEAKSWPFDLIEYYGISSYFERSFNEYGEFRPLPTGWKLERIGVPIEKSAVVCKGNAAEDLERLRFEFGDDYIANIKEKICNSKQTHIKD